MCFALLVLAEFMVTCQILALHLTVFGLFTPHLPRHPEDANIISWSPSILALHVLCLSPCQVDLVIDVCYLLISPWLIQALISILMCWRKVGMHSSCQGWISDVYEILKSTAELADLKKAHTGSQVTAPITFSKIIVCAEYHILLYFYSI